MPLETLILLCLLISAGFYMAWSIGANDVANAMGTSVGSGALTLKSAVIIAAILEFSGAFFFGSHVSDTIQAGIIDSAIFADNPRILVYGMLSSLLASGVWLQVASYFGWPVSTTHCIIGAIVGFGITIGGIEAIQWPTVFFIISSWVVSPVLGGIISFLLFNLLRKKIFYTLNPIESAKTLTPLIVFFTISLMGTILIFNGLKNMKGNYTFFDALLISLILGALFAVASWFLIRKVSTSVRNASPALKYAAVEKIFGYLQIMSACLMAFAHGANDVANAIGPLTEGVQVLLANSVITSHQTPMWALGLGGVGIVIGLATWGWRVIETIGKKITELTPTRGFAAELGTALTVVLASRLGLPISTTHTLVGSVIGVGLARGMGALDLSMTRDIMISWAVTVPAGAFLAVGLYNLISLIFN